MSTSHFELLRTRAIATLNVEVQEYRHRSTGAMHYHLAAANRNNCFAVAFPTVPMDSTGVAHILEHTVLCGSRRYPVRDPFFMMLRRSLNTFMNAFTTSDATVYPFATQNRKDFDNLLGVYLDAVFFPRLDELDFAQEGYRVDFEKPGDPSSPLVYRGVVYNEMKGAMSAPIAQVQMELQSLLFPTTTYHYNSGGDPAHIPELSYEQLKAFHAHHYHPSNAVFMTYGDFPVAEHQQRFQEWALQHFQYQAFNIDRRDEQRYTRPLTSQGYYANTDANLRERTYIALGWLLGRSGDSNALIRDLLLSNVLLQHSASPLRRVLETSPLGSAPLEFSGLDDSAREALFVCGLEGSEPEHAEALQKQVFDVLNSVAEKGTPRDEIEAVLTHIEIAQRDMNGGHYPYGLQLMNRVHGATVHGGDAFEFLDIEPAIERLRSDVQEPAFFPSLVRRLLDNPHCVRLVMSPDPELAARNQRQERQRLDAIQLSLSESDKDWLVKRARTLDDRQRHNDPELLPKLGIADVPADLNIPEGRDGTLGELPVTVYEEGSNGLVHQQVILELPALMPEEAEVLVLYYQYLTEVGSAGRDYLATQRLSARLGAMSAYVSVRASVHDINTMRGYVSIAGKSLVRDHERLAALMRDTLEAPRFDELDRLRELVAQTRAAQESSVTDRGHSLAILAAGRGMSAAGYLDDLWDGLVSIQRIRKLDQALQDTQSQRQFGERLAAIHARLRGQPRRLLIVCEPRHVQTVSALLQSVWKQSAEPPRPPFSWSPQYAKVREAWVANTQINFCARVYPAVPADHPDAPMFSVLGKFLHHGYLHRAVREQGGAYGSGASYDSDSGSLRFFSYRDPRLEGTLRDFDTALEWLQGQHGGRELEEAILGVIQQIDQPKSPVGDAIQAYFHRLQGRTPEFRRRFRKRVLAVTIADLQRVGQQYLLPQLASTAVITNEETLERHRHLGFAVKTI